MIWDVFGFMVQFLHLLTNGFVTMAHTQNLTKSR